MFLTNNSSLTDLKLYKYTLQIDQIEHIKNICYVSYIMTSELFLKMKLINEFLLLKICLLLSSAFSLHSK